MNKKYFIIFVIILFSGLGFWYFCSTNKNYENIIASPGSIQENISSQGKVEAYLEVDLAFKIFGKIKNILKNEGEDVKKGEILAILENDFASARLSYARSALFDANNQLDRVKELYQSNSGPRSNLDSAQSKYDMMKAEKNAQESIFLDHFIKSPMDGKIVAKYFEIGESVNPGVAVFKVANLEKIRVRAEIDETDIGKLHLNQIAQISSDAFPNKIFTGKVIEIGHMVGRRKIRLDDPSLIVDSKILEAKIELENTEELKLGMTVDVKIDIL
jgi:RND family efflux transporter MFP subunit